MAGFPQGHALVVGVGEYSDRRWNVPTATRDAADFAAALQDPGSGGYSPANVELLGGAAATREGVLAALGRLANEAVVGEVALVSFTCHGALGTDGLYYLATVDTRFSPERMIVAGTGISSVELARALRELPARRLLLLVNACFAGHVGARLGTGGIDPESAAGPFGTMLPNEVGRELVSTGEGRAIITAGKADQLSFLLEHEPHSLFGQALIDAVMGRGVNGASGYIGLFELYDAVYRQVTGAAQRKLGVVQEPALTVLQSVGAFPIASYHGATGSEQLLSQRPPDGAAVQVVPPITVNVTNKRSVISFDGATIMGDVRTGNVVEGDLTIYGDGRTSQDDDQAFDPARKLSQLLARVEVARNVDEDARDDAANKLRQAQRALGQGDTAKARLRIDEALFTLRAMNNAYVNSAIKGLEKVLAVL